MSAGTLAAEEQGSRLRVPLMLLGVLAVAIGSLVLYLQGGRVMSTDDAYVQAARASISSSVAGRVVEIAVHDNQRVHKGELLFRLDDDTYRVAVEAAEAKLGNARLEVGAGKATYRKQLAAIRSARETLAFEQHNVERERKLVASGIASEAQVQQAQHALDSAREGLVAAEHQADAILAMLDGQASLDPARHPAVLQAKAELDRARLNLSYTRIVAPDDGIVTKVEALQVGDYINAASPVFALMSTRNVWIEANFKEDQLTHMRAGQRATVAVDSYPDQELRGHVASIAPGTGSQFTALPPENATGNWVKVVQRVPVRIELENADTEQLMSAGLSATVKVDTGHQRHLFGAASDATFGARAAP
jgi:membrane fusion protein (multidrug efflux system)